MDVAKNTLYRGSKLMEKLLRRDPNLVPVLKHLEGEANRILGKDSEEAKVDSGPLEHFAALERRKLRKRAAMQRKKARIRARSYTR